MERIETKTYQISKLQLAYWSTFEYGRRFWPGFIAFPITGVLLMVLIQFRPIQALGLLMILWPLSIPARSILITSKASKRSVLPTRMVYEGEHLYFFVEPDSKNYRVHRDSIRDVKSRIEYVVIELWKYRLLFIPYSAFHDREDIQKLRLATGVIDELPNFGTTD